jgi:hypothetical protein
MTRQTSVEAYQRIKDDGLLKGRHLELYEILFEQGPLTANQAFDVLAARRGGDFRYDSNTRARFTELRNMGVIDEVGTTKDPVTGFRVIQWDVTDRVPARGERAERKPAVMDAVTEMAERLEKLEAEVARLKGIWGNTGKPVDQGQIALF